MSTRRYYLDTSAYLCILLGEEGSSEMVERIAGQELLSSSLMILEANRNLVRLARMGVLPPESVAQCLDHVESDIEQLILRDLSLDLCRGLEMPVVTIPRSLDLAHIRTALWFHRLQPLTEFLTTDRTQRQAARELGLPVSD